MACLELWDFLEGKGQTKFVIGSAGIGKSILVTLYALWKSWAVTVIYLHFSGLAVFYSIIKRGRVASRIFAHVDEIWKELLKRVCSFSDSNILVVADGSVSDYVNVCISVCVIAKREIIVCTSFQISDKYFSIKFEYDFKFHTMPAWSREDVDNACKFNCFNFGSEQLETQVYYCGTNVRLLNESVEDVKHFLDMQLMRLSSVEALFTGPILNNATDSLKAVYKYHESMIVSQYVMNRLSLSPEFQLRATRQSQSCLARMRR